MLTVASPLSSGYAMTESPRWHAGRLWFVDMHQYQVIAVGPDGKAEVMADLPGQAGGIGWLPDGRLLVVVQDQRRILRQDDSGLVVHADLSDEVPSLLNDMWVDAAGRAYVGEMGFDAHEWFDSDPQVAANWFSGEAPALDVPVTSRLLVVDPDGSSRVAAHDLVFPNGIVVDESSRTLIVAETFAARLAVFDIAPDGSLSRRETWPLGFYPDGIGLDGAGAVWVSDPVKSQARRVTFGGEETGRVSTDQTCIACAVGGEDDRTLFLCTAPTTEPEAARAGLGGRIDAASLATGMSQ
ncbi:SMP-30/gluconolaconase/LRE-like region-containing protein [Nocardia nova SH22a]|uniref:SMP-30/gluconolaconase/LRE-like region-containing protein n=1 Tax=Nocardia nova SH22a TaxID=1415166 RepID=W5TGV3_9NOCA|nr:SMP-30/gluconolaconase/LRE-like region-containing protein [Nocardia nova SH22a]